MHDGRHLVSSRVSTQTVTEQRPVEAKPARPLGRRGTPRPAEPSWGYEKHNGPTLWGTLDPAFRTCACGAEQSPIDLSGGTVDVAPVEFDYRRTRLAIENTGHTIQVAADPGSGIVLNKAYYELQQFHFHHGSEHTVDGVRLPLEMHLVHRNDSGALAVVGVLFAEGAVNDALAPVWAHLPCEPVGSHMVPGEVDLASLLPARRSTWRYRGSLTTPPCTEGVAWVILTEPLTMSAAQIAALAAVYPHNWRPVQPRGERVLYRG